MTVTGQYSARALARARQEKTDRPKVKNDLQTKQKCIYNTSDNRNENQHGQIVLSVMVSRCLSVLALDVALNAVLKEQQCYRF